MLHDLGAILIDPIAKKPMHKWKDRAIRARHASPAAIRRHVAKGRPVAISPCDAGSFALDVDRGPVSDVLDNVDCAPWCVVRSSREGRFHVWRRVSGPVTALTDYSVGEAEGQTRYDRFYLVLWRLPQWLDAYKLREETAPVAKPEDFAKVTFRRAERAAAGGGAARTRAATTARCSPPFRRSSSGTGWRAPSARSGTAAISETHSSGWFAAPPPPRGSGGRSSTPRSRGSSPARRHGRTPPRATCRCGTRPTRRRATGGSWSPATRSGTPRPRANTRTSCG